ncbi:putative sugar transporter, partial [Operophtera brumata]
WCGARGVWAARAAAGAGGAGALALAPVYCAEIAPRTRGLAAMPALACSCGILFAYAAGGLLSAHALSLSMAAPPVVLLVCLLWLPETPSFLISIGRDAAKIICWFDGSDFQEDLTDVIEQQEVRIRTSDFYGGRREMRRQDSDTFQPMLKRSSGLDSTSNSDKKSEKTELSACRELFRHRRSRRALFSCIVITCAAVGSGAGAVNSFAAAVLRHSAHTMLLLWSCTGITCCLALLGVYCDPRLHHSWYFHRLWPYRKPPMKNTNYLTENITFIEENSDVLIKNLTVEGYRSGDVNLASEFTYKDNLTEWLKNVAEYKEDGTMVTPMVLLSLMLFLYNIGLGFLLLRYYGSLAVTLGLHGTYYISASITLLGAGYILLTVPETRGRSREQIDKALEGPMLVVCQER